MKKLAVLILACLLLAGCAAAEPPEIVEILPVAPSAAAEYTVPQPDETPGDTPAAAAPVSPQETAPAEAEQPLRTDTPAETAQPTPENTPENTPEKTPEPAPQETPYGGGEKPLSGLTIGVDAGHQAHANRDKEPVSPGSSETKNKVSSGTQGVVTGIPEYQVNLNVALLLQKLLQDAGASVVMVRTENDVDISNVERAQLFNEKRTDYAIRLHCNGSDDGSRRGAFMLVPKENPFKEDCERAAQLVIDAYCEETGIKNRGLTYRGDQTGFNWCERMVINIEMGHMTNADEDRLLTDEAFQKKMAEGIFKGILAFYAS